MLQWEATPKPPWLKPARVDFCLTSLVLSRLAEGPRSSQGVTASGGQSPTTLGPGHLGTVFMSFAAGRHSRGPPSAHPSPSGSNYVPASHFLARASLMEVEEWSTLALLQGGETKARFTRKFFLRGYGIDL